MSSRCETYDLEKKKDEQDRGLHFNSWQESVDYYCLVGMGYCAVQSIHIRLWNSRYYGLNLYACFHLFGAQM